MKTKKIMSLVLAMVMALALAVPAFAATTAIENPNVETPGGKAQTAVTGEAAVPTIKVSVPTTGKVIANPYKLTVDLTPEDTSDDVTDDKQIIAPALLVMSESNIGLSVDVTVTGKPAKGVTFATATTVGNTKLKDKSVFMYIDAQPVDFNTDAETTQAAADALTAGDYDKTSATQVLVGATAATKAGILTLDAGAVGSPKCGAFLIAGDAVEAPSTAWTTADKVDLTIAFTFNPVAISA